MLIQWFLGLVGLNNYPYHLDSKLSPKGTRIENCPCGKGVQAVGVFHYGFDMEFLGETKCQCGRTFKIKFGIGDDMPTGFVLTP